MSRTQRKIAIGCSKQTFNQNLNYAHSGYQQSVRFLSTAAEIYNQPQYNYSHLSEMQIKSCATFKENPLFGTRNGQKFDWITYGEFGHQVDKFRYVLTKHGIGKNDKVGIISNNRVEWAVAAYATASLGAQYVPM
jgi:long-subunit acyl-CoA synthetase (AMP-forming)